MPGECTVDTETLQCRVAEMRKILRPLLRKEWTEIEKHKVYNLERTTYTTDFDAVDVPVIEDTFAELPKQKENDGKLLTDLKHQILMLTILKKKKSCPITQIIDRL